ncbi:hypothetical protein RSOLAG1IB_03445 [Rhizoctonia solani AG-1 IB]|uniref:Uncharacterized protein n=1 Tax=Thanatephorus cucumeris (strain AG1-IB / isolate 7/3/14) TaxID=1108050 RepID=A0A0B7FTJ7_THACB|nr:hypothetical protein RSOLAG1IB_03445 [Rhizoctonia solani AG-1 IB]
MHVSISKAPSQITIKPEPRVEILITNLPRKREPPLAKKPLLRHAGFSSASPASVHPSHPPSPHPRFTQ